MPGYAQRAVFFYLEIVTRCASLQYYTVLVYVSVLVGVVHFRLFPIFKAHFHCQAHLLDTIYCVCAPHIAHIQCDSCACCPCGRVAVVPPARSLPADRRACSSARARVRPPARVCGRARVWPRVCVGACVCAALASVVRVISFAYIVDSPAVLPRAGLAANFFEIVFGQSISIPSSSA